MEKIIAIFAISVGLIIFIVGILADNFTLIFSGPIISVLLFVFSYIKISKKGKEKAFIPEDKYQTILSSRSKKDMRRLKERFLSIFMGLVLAIIVWGIIWFFLNAYLYTPSSLSIENIINEGCRELNPGTGRCEKDPSTIIVNYDVNDDGIIGGVNDTLSNLLEEQECVGKCIKERCGCIT